MRDTTEQLIKRLVILLEQAERDRSALSAPGMEKGRELYSRLFDSLTATLHNLQSSSADQKHGD